MQENQPIEIKMITMMPEFEEQVNVAFEAMQQRGGDEVIFGRGFVLARDGSDAAEAWKAKGETLNAFSINNVPLIVVSPGESL